MKKVQEHVFIWLLRHFFKILRDFFLFFYVVALTHSSAYIIGSSLAE